MKRVQAANFFLRLLAFHKSFAVDFSFFVVVVNLSLSAFAFPRHLLSPLDFYSPPLPPPPPSRDKEKRARETAFTPTTAMARVTHGVRERRTRKESTNKVCLTFALLLEAMALCGFSSHLRHPFPILTSQLTNRVPSSPSGAPRGPRRTRAPTREERPVPRGTTGSSSCSSSQSVSALVEIFSSMQFPILPLRRPAPPALRSAFFSLREGRGERAKSPARRAGGESEERGRRWRGAKRNAEVLFSFFLPFARRFSTATFFPSSSSSSLFLFLSLSLSLTRSLFPSSQTPFPPPSPSNSQETLPPRGRGPARDPQVPALDRAADQEAAVCEAGEEFFLFSFACSKSGFFRSLSLSLQPLSKTPPSPPSHYPPGARDHQRRGPGTLPVDGRGAAGAAGGEGVFLPFVAFFFFFDDESSSFSLSHLSSLPFHKTHTHTTNPKKGDGGLYRAPVRGHQPVRYPRQARDD